MYAGVLFLLFVICRKNSRCTFSNISIFSNPIISQEYHNDPKFSDKYSWANSADPDQTAEEQSDQGLTCLLFRLHHLDSLLYGRATKFKF